MNRRFIRELSNLKKEVAAMRPTRAPGVLTAHTSRGVLRRVNSLYSSFSNSSTTTSTPRWA